MLRHAWRPALIPTVHPHKPNGAQDSLGLSVSTAMRRTTYTPSIGHGRCCKQTKCMINTETQPVPDLKRCFLMYTRGSSTLDMSTLSRRTGAFHPHIVCTSQVNEHKQMEHVKTERFIISQADVASSHERDASQEESERKEVCVSVSEVGNEERERAGMTEL